VKRYWPRKGFVRIKKRVIKLEMCCTGELGLALKQAKKLGGVVEFKEEEETGLMMDKMAAALDAVIMKHMDLILDRPGAEYLKEAMKTRKAEFGVKGVMGVELIEGVKRLLRKNRFKGVCPSCRGAQCGDCKGKGWVTFAMAAKLRNAGRGK
jgi:hypothetical protein